MYDVIGDWRINYKKVHQLFPDHNGSSKHIGTYIYVTEELINNMPLAF